MERSLSAGAPCEKDYHCGIYLYCAEGACRNEPSTYLPPRPRDAGVDAAKAPPEPLVLPFRPSNVGDLIEGRMVGPDSDIVVGMESDCKPCACDHSVQVSLTESKTGCFKGSSRTGPSLEIEMMAMEQTGSADLPRLHVVFLKNLVIGPSRDHSFFLNGGTAGGVVIVVQDKIEIATRGAYTFSGYYGFDGASPMSTGAGDYGKGPGGGGFGAGTNLVASGSGEGGAHCALGGLGYNQTTPHGKTYGSASLVPLWTGSGGGTPNGSSTAGFGGRGGPAFQLVAGTSIVIAAGAGFTAPGFGARTTSSAGGSINNGGGGGSGGSLLLEAPTVEIQGELTALGGPGAGDYRAGGTGGDGRIRFNTMAEGLTIAPGAMIQPAYPGPCATLGELTLVP